jgi:hypothetical protein
MLRSASETLGFIKPELPTLVPEPPTGEGWIREIKYDASIAARSEPSPGTAMTGRGPISGASTPALGWPPEPP